MASGAASSAIDPAQLEGGYAGWEARWSLATGKPKTVPDHYLPESFKEWEVDVWGESGNHIGTTLAMLQVLMMVWGVL